MPIVPTPVANLQFYKNFLAEQLKDGLADLLDDMSPQEFDSFTNLVTDTEKAIISIDVEMRG